MVSKVLLSKGEKTTWQTPLFERNIGDSKHGNRPTGQTAGTCDCERLLQIHFGYVN